MKSLVVALSVIFVGALFSAADIEDGILSDPRPTLVRKVYSDGEVLKNAKIPYVIVAWAQPPKDSEEKGYQIWGNSRILDKSALERAIASLMNKSQADIYVVGNDWAAGSELNTFLRGLSKKHKFDVYFGSPYYFSRLAFRPESGARQKQVSDAVESATRTEQDAAPQIRPR